MYRVVGLYGEPATGKSSLMREILDELEGRTELIPAGFGTMLRFQEYQLEDRTVCVLGVYPKGETFGGTDRLSMAVPPEAAMWFEIAPRIFQHPVIVWEGDRLLCETVLQALGVVRRYSTGEVHLFALRCTEGELKRRHEERGDTQTEAWLRGRRTKVERFAAEYDMTWLDNNNEDDQARNLELLRRLVFK